MVIREETAADPPAIGALNRVVFGGDYEVQLIAGLRAANLVQLSLVACEGEEIVGHILFSILAVRVDGREVRASALAPMAVSPGHQRRGIGSRLVVEGLDRLRERRVEAVIVLGHRAYYPRFGFSPEFTRRLDSPFRSVAEFMGLELVPGALSGEGGDVRYPAPFGL